MSNDKKYEYIPIVSVDEEIKSVKKDLDEFQDKQRTKELSKILLRIKTAISKEKTHIHVYHRLFKDTIDSLERENFNVKVHPLICGYEISWRLDIGK